ncbi:hypothetical protein BN2364_2579 [Alloalcanivorax xenomutans]|nr:hypothetical protein BN2364_2579 [Alloalcanivorax xenomutans]
MIATAMYPAAQFHRLPIMGGPQITAIMASHVHSPVLSSFWPAPAHHRQGPKKAA